ncbi:MAG: polyprenyl synthetase family protein, partial [Oscillospiraceae bacterium]
KYGEALAILAGDGLQTMAFEVLSSEENIEKIGGSKALLCVKALSHAIGENGMLGGQAIDVLNENIRLGQEEHLSMVSMKTAALIVASIHIGGIAAAAPSEDLGKALEFGFNLGVAFQIKDDLLDVVGNAKSMGKEIGRDEKNHKNTFTSLYGIEETKKLSDAYHQKSLEALNALKILNYPTEVLFEATNFLAQRNF